MNARNQSWSLPATMLLVGSVVIAAYMVAVFRSWAVSAATYTGGMGAMSAITALLVALVVAVPVLLALYLYTTRQSI
jgi:uncharacterized membrane protein